MSSPRPSPLDPAFLREQIVGIDATFGTPFGERMMVYCDYTASGRGLRFVENYLQSLQRIYANTHTEDDITGRSMSHLLHQAEAAIKASVRAGPNGRLIACGTGATAAIHKLQQILGVALAPATRRNLDRILEAGELAPRFRELAAATQPVVFVGPYEHHSNEISWRESLATTVMIGLDANGQLDLEDLEARLRDPRFEGRLRIGSFSAASNVTGVRTDVHRVAALLHRHQALACFDFAACAPYVDIDMNPEPGAAGEDPSLDAIYISPHKFLGGPGSTGILVFNERIYDRSLPPTVCAGGTVDYVGMHDQDFIADVEAREKAGTPGVLQTLKAGLVFQIKDRVGIERIEAREHELTAWALGAFAEEPGIEILGHPDPARRVGIISFNVRAPDGRYLHHKLLTTLLNDLFGIQSRAGCSCAGPYGHRLLGIDDPTSERYRALVHRGHCGMKPGWCRIGLHWVMDDAEAEYVIEAVRFLARSGALFLPLYEFEMSTGSWTHRRCTDDLPAFSVEAALETKEAAPSAFGPGVRRQLYRHYLDEAEAWAARLREAGPLETTDLTDELVSLQFFAVPSRAAP